MKTTFKLLALGLLYTIASSTGVAQTLTITEFLADNDSLEMDENGDYEDWIEIYNQGPGTANLAEYSLTDDLDNPDKWVFPAGTTLAPNTYLRVWASGKFGGTDVLTNIHTSFKLGTKIGYLGLYRNVGGVYQVQDDYPAYPPQFRDTSYGVGVGAGVVSPYYMVNATPAISNGALHTPPPGFVAGDPIVGGDLAVKISEIMFDPNPLRPAEIAAGFLTNDFEFVEFYNDLSTPINIFQLEITQGIRFNFVSSSQPNLAPGEYALLVANISAFEFRYGTGLPVIGTFALGNRLDNDGDAIAIRRRSDGTPIYLVEYNNGGEWPKKASGFGASIEACDPNTILDPNSPDYYCASDTFYGSPGGPPVALTKDIIINEVNSHSNIGEDWFELYNRGTAAIDVGGWFVTDIGNPTSYVDRVKYAIPSPTVIQPGGYQRIFQSDIGFGFKEDGDDVVLSIGNGFEVLGFGPSVDFGAADQDIPFGRYVRSDGKTDFTVLSFQTPDAVNAPPRIGPIVIAEIMYNELGSDASEYVVLQNITASAVPMFDPANPANTWQLRGSADYIFPPGITIPANGFLIVSQTNATGFAYSKPASVQVLGPWTNKLGNGSGEVEIKRPAAPEADGSVNYVTIDQVDYDDDLPWPINADGTGNALLRVSPTAYGKDPGSWIDATPMSSLSTPFQSDNDGDGLPDVWEFTFYNSTAFSNGSGDPDGDGFSDLSEFVAGTSPTVATEFPGISITWDADADVLMVPTTLTGGAGTLQRQRRYTIQYKNNLPDAAWQNLPPYVNLPALGTPIMYSSPVGMQRRFYRVAITLN